MPYDIKFSYAVILTFVLFLICCLFLSHKRKSQQTMKELRDIFKENPTDMEKLIIKLCDADVDYTDKDSIAPLLDYIK